MRVENGGWRRNGRKYERRKAIREESRKRWLASGRTDCCAVQVYGWAHAKIRRFYDVVPLDYVHSWRRKLWAE